MTIILKEINILEEWHLLGPIYVKEDIELWPIMTRFGKLYDRSASSILAKIHMRFHGPDKVRQFNHESILMVRDNFPAFDKIMGSWPFDRPDVLRCPPDMDELYKNYGISDIRMLAWRE